MAMLYFEDAAMKVFHNACHPRMVEFLGPAMRVFAGRRLSSGGATPDASGVGSAVRWLRRE